MLIQEQTSQSFRRLLFPGKFHKADVRLTNKRYGQIYNFSYSITNNGQTNYL